MENEKFFSDRFSGFNRNCGTSIMLAESIRSSKDQRKASTQWGEKMENVSG
jgi:hypothetical protein